MSEETHCSETKLFILVSIVVNEENSGTLFFAGLRIRRGRSQRSRHIVLLWVSPELHVLLRSLFDSVCPGREGPSGPFLPGH